MSNATPHSRQSGDSQRRRSRGGRNRNNQQQDNRRGGDRESRESRGARDVREGRNPGRSEEFRPQAPRPPRAAVPVKASWWQKLLKVVSFGFYTGPKPPVRGERKPEAFKPQADARPAKTNTRNARTSEGGERPERPEMPEGGSAPRGNRGGERSRGGDRTTVESPRVYVGNLSYDVTEQDLQELFKGIGGVRNVEIVYNRSTHRSKGYGFVEMLHMDEAMRAVEVLHDQPFMGRKLTVSGAKSKGQDEREDREERPERAQRPIVVAPRPTPAVVTETTVDEEPEPTLQTIVETVTEVPEEVDHHIVQAPVAGLRAVAEPVAETPPAAEVETPTHMATEAPHEVATEVAVATANAVPASPAHHAETHSGVA